MKPAAGTSVLASVAPFASLAAALFPKCPICLAAYLGMLGVAGLDRLAYSKWLFPLLVGVIALNLGGLWLRCRGTGRWRAFAVAGVGAVMLVTPESIVNADGLRPLGASLTLLASVLLLVDARSPRTGVLTVRRS